MYTNYFIVEVYKRNYSEKPIKSLAFANEGLARTYAEGLLQGQAMLGKNELYCEIIEKSY